MIICSRHRRRARSSVIDDVPHTGTLVYKEGMPKIPAVAISTLDGDLLSDLLKNDNDIQFQQRVKGIFPVWFQHLAEDLSGAPR